MSPSKASKLSPARLLAFEVLRQTREREAFTGEVLRQVLEDRQDRGSGETRQAKPLSPADVAFATKLALGVTSTRGTLDEIIDRFLKTPGSVSKSVRDVLRLSCYEIVFLQKSPHAAVDQGVELVKRLAPRAAGLVNAVLRRTIQALPQFPFGDPVTDPAAFARQYAFPRWLCDRLVRELGRTLAERFMQASNEDAPLFIAVNALKADDEEVKALFEEIDAPLNEMGIPGCFRLGDPRSINHPQVKRLFSQGKILVSDASSQAVAQFVLPREYPGSFLEIGAGRGTKTILLQSNAQRRWGRQMKLSSLDSHAFKGNLLRKRAVNYGVVLEEVYTQDATELAEFFGDTRFDAIFIDAPCSGLGTLRRHPEIRWRITPEEIAGLARLQQRMLASAVRQLEPGGLLAYSTCTVTRAENEKVIGDFLQSEQGADFSLVPLGKNKVFSSWLAPGSPDAHFAARMERSRQVL